MEKKLNPVHNHDYFKIKLTQWRLIGFLLDLMKQINHSGISEIQQYFADLLEVFVRNGSWVATYYTWLICLTEPSYNFSQPSLYCLFLKVFPDSFLQINSGVVTEIWKHESVRYINSINRFLDGKESKWNICKRNNINSIF